MTELIISNNTKRNFLLNTKPKIYNSASIDEKKIFIKDILRSLCIDNNLPEIENDNIKFAPLLDKEKSFFDLPSNIIINEKLLNYDINENEFNLQNADEVSYCLLLNLIHEFRHYQQYCENKDLDNEIIKGLKAPLSGTDLYLFQEHEKDAFVTAFKSTKELSPLLDGDFIN